MKENKNVPKGFKSSSLGPIPDDWEVKRLGEVCSAFKSGQGITSDSIFNDGDYAVYGGNGLRGYTSNFTHEGNYLLIGRQGALCGNITLISGRNYVSEHAIAVQTNGENDIFFLGYKLDFLNLNRYSESSAQPGLSVEKLVRLKITFPPTKEQTAIANVLSVWDKAINNLIQLITKKELNKKWLTQQLITGKKRLKGFKGKWKEGHLGEFFDERNETNCIDLPLLSIGQSGVYPQHESVKKDNSNEDKSKYRRICPDDIGYNTMRMWQGRSALSKLEGIVSPAYTILKPKKNADALFFSYLFKTPKLVNSFFRNSQGLVEDTLNCKYKDFAIIKVHLPLKDEQVAIARIIQRTENELKVLERKVELLKMQKMGLMQILLTGKKRISL